MPTITVQKDDLYHLANLDSTVSLSELELRLQLVKGELTLRSHSGQKVKVTDAANHPAVDLELRIELNDTNRPDLWSVEGVARQLRDHMRGFPGDYAFFTTESVDRTIDVDPKLADIRPYIGGFYAHGQEIDETALLAFIETQETLTRNFGRKRQSVSIGLYRGDELTFPLCYRAVGREAVRFVPLAPAGDPDNARKAAHAMTPDEILVHHATGREYASILADQPLVPLLTDAQDQVLALIPIINSADLGRVTRGTAALFVEASGTELDQVLLTLNILATNLADRGWSIEPVTTHYPYDTACGRAITVPYPLALTQTVPTAEFAHLLGEPVDGPAIVERLSAYGVCATVDPDHADSIAATAPDYRQDYLHPVDVIEDYAMSRGYANFTPTMPADFTVGKLQPLTEFEDLVRDLLIGFGFEEAFCNILTSREGLQERMNLSQTEGKTAPFHGGKVVQVANVMNRNYAIMRDWIVPSLLEIEAHSLGALYPHRIFEVGEVAVYDPTQNLGSRTESRASGIIATDDASFDSAQSVVYALLGSLGVAFQVTPWQHPSFIAGRVGLIATADGLPLGFLGELSPVVLTNWGMRTPIAAFELSLNGVGALLSVV